MQTQSVRIVENLSQNARQPGIQNGATVQGRVISASGNSYIVSVGGSQIQVKSNLPLQAGQTFSAKVNVQNGTVFLNLLSHAESPGGILKNLSFDGKNLTPELSRFLQNLGLPPESQALSLLQTARELGVKFNFQNIKKALVTGKKFPQDEEDAGQTSLLLQEKGLDGGEEAVESVFAGLGQNHKEKNQGQKDNEKDSPGGQNSDGESSEITEDDVKSYFDSLDSAAASHKKGMLSLFNSAKNKNSSVETFNWMILPFEWKLENLIGEIRVLSKGSEKKLKKIAINCQKKRKNYRCVVYFNSHRISKVQIGRRPDFSAEEKVFARKIAASVFGNTEIDLPDFAELAGFASENLPFMSAGGLA